MPARTGQAIAADGCLRIAHGLRARDDAFQVGIEHAFAIGSRTRDGFFNATLGASRLFFLRLITSLQIAKTFCLSGFIKSGNRLLFCANGRNILPIPTEIRA